MGGGLFPNPVRTHNHHSCFLLTTGSLDVADGYRPFPPILDSLLVPGGRERILGLGILYECKFVLTVRGGR